MGDPDLVDRERETVVKSRFAIPEARLVGDANAGHGELIVTAPSTPPNVWAPDSGAVGDGGDGD